MKQKFDKKLVEKVADLANLSIKKNQIDRLINDFNETMKVVDKLTEINQNMPKATTQVNHLTNVLRKDEVKPSLSQEEALKNAPKTHNGYFVVDRLINRD
jgi:aspartyl-tRNA(Asn)/glutamyl-tRNA(Gln) amidotransferase subunit C